MLEEGQAKRLPLLYMDKIARIRQLVNFKVEGKYEPMKHQWISGVFMAEHKRCFNLSTMRTGKTGSTLLAYRLLRSTKRARKMLVLAPLSTLRAVWYDSVSYTLLRAHETPEHLVCRLLLEKKK